MRREFELTEEQLALLLDACLGSWVNANAAWEALGKELGFSHLTARPVSGKCQRFFTAEVAPD